MMPESTSPLPAVASGGPAGGGQAARRGVPAVGCGHRGQRSLQQDDGTGGPGQAPRRGEAVLRRWPPRLRRAYSPSWGVRMVGALRLSSRVRAASRRRRARSARRRRSPAGPGRRRSTARISSAVASSRAEPGPDAPRPCTWPSPRGRRRPNPSAGRCMRTASVGQAAGGVARRAQADHAGAGGHGAAGAQDGRTLHARRAGGHPDRVRPLVDLARARRGRAPRRRRPRPAAPAASGTRSRCRPPRRRRCAPARRPGAGRA